MLLRTKDTADLQVAFSDFFTKMINMLSAKHLDSSVIRQISQQRDKVVTKAMSLDIPENRIPFLLVFPHSYQPFDDQLNLIIDPRGDASFNLDPDQIEDESNFSRPYFIFGIEDGEETQGQPFYGVQEDFRNNGVLPLTAAEVISVAMFHGSLEKRNLLAMGSSYNGERRFLILQTSSSDYVKSFTTAPPAHIFSEHIGTPSCMHRAIFN